MFRLFSTAVFKVTRALLPAPLILPCILTTDAVALGQRAPLSQVSTHHGQSFLVSAWNPVVTS